MAHLQINRTPLKLDLLGLDSNAFSIMGAFRVQAKREGWSQSEIDEVLEEARRSNYDHLLATIMAVCVNGGTGYTEEDLEDLEPIGGIIV